MAADSAEPQSEEPPDATPLRQKIIPAKPRKMALLAHSLLGAILVVPLTFWFLQPFQRPDVILNVWLHGIPLGVTTAIIAGQTIWAYVRHWSIMDTLIHQITLAGLMWLILWLPMRLVDLKITADPARYAGNSLNWQAIGAIGRAILKDPDLYSFNTPIIARTQIHFVLLINPSRTQLPAEFRNLTIREIVVTNAGSVEIDLVGANAGGRVIILPEDSTWDLTDQELKKRCPGVWADIRAYY